MDRDELLRRPLVAVFAVTRPDGRVHATPLWYLWDGDVFHMSVIRNSPRHSWSAAAGRASLCIEVTEGDDLSFVTAEGPIAVVDPLTKDMRFQIWAHYRGSDHAGRVIDGGGNDDKVEL